MPEMLARFAIYACSVYISCHYVNGPWIVGPVFGLAVISWDSNSFRGFAAKKHLAFTAASSLIWALVYTISSQNWNRGSDFADSLYGSLPIAVVAGSVLLPLTHRILLGASFRTTARTISYLVLSYYFVAFFSLANDSFGWGMRLNFLLMSLGAWQGAYLYSFFLQDRRP